MDQGSWLVRAKMPHQTIGLNVLLRPLPINYPKSENGSGFRYEKRGKLVRLNVTNTERHMRENVEAANLALAAEILFVHDPLDAEDVHLPDPSHALASGVPEVGAGPATELIGDLFLDCILD